MRALFVDDDVQVLRGLARMCESAEDDWDVETATSGAEALNTLGAGSFDVVVSDMHMPGMDGAAFLEEVSQRHPNVIRIILSGQASKDSVLRAVAPMHQYLSKPCEHQVLRATVNRACALRDMLKSPELHELVSRITTLPSFPPHYQEVVRQVESPHGTVARLGEIISKDPAMTAKILQLANSSYFGLRGRVTSPAQAASLLGMENIKALVMSLHIFKTDSRMDAGGLSIEQLFDHGLTVAGFARAIAAQENTTDGIANEAFTAGLLHDVGKLVLATNLPGEFSKTLEIAQQKHLPDWQAERECLGASHDAVGAHLLALWGLPQPIVETVALHHIPGQCHEAGFSVLTAVHVANFLAHEKSGRVDSHLETTCHEYLDAVGVLDRLPQWRSACQAVEKQET